MDALFVGEKFQILFGMLSFFVLIEKRKRRNVIKILCGLFQSESSCQNHTQPEGKKTAPR
jgi:hypothetical protein